ncbi:isoleucine--tRNA ligase [Sandaracinomonas limnophila]|uniref:Isoleucine--tRNA ligase n=1 Tax=Sandaracinomonas limnophila TaxID=1862386 RepID=A0A437PRI5_9BACT|nr:isoleucine--tRNA ligase [Sandaracinomonas limnophila]RVU24878.1 isoleucine--tRNA ligase [Sandaracinomonas limnophila]
MSFKEYKNLDYAQVADEILSFWKSNEIFEKSITSREGHPTFTFFEGPPSANGTPGIHHVMARTIKDIFCRYQTLKGKQVKRKGGWDTHGLPVELQVEKELGITKEDIGKSISVEEYNQKCRETVMKFTDQWNDLTEKMGYWVDLEDPYVTYHATYIESVWNLLKKLYEKGLLYKGYTIQPYSPAAGTGLSSHELNQPGCYRDVKDTSLTAQFKVKNTEKSTFLFDAAGSEVYILAWTTTPWTLPSNAALTAGKNIEYVLIKTFNPYTFLPVNVVLAKDLIKNYFKAEAENGDFDAFAAADKKPQAIPYQILKTFKGSEIEGVEYEQLMAYVQPEAPAFRVILGDFVTTEDGTGIVHTAPTFGADDFRVAQQNGIPAIVVKDENGKEVPLVNRQGKFVKEVTDYALEFVKEAYLSEEEKEIEKAKQGRDKYLSVDERIAIQLKTENKAFNVQKFDHPYPHCWRTDKPVLYYPLDSWFIKTTAVKDKLIALNKTIQWKPESTGTGRFGNWLENLVDWNLSRSRYWGTPLPIWRTEDESEEVCMGSLADLLAGLKKALESGKLDAGQIKGNEAFLAAAAKGEADLHRPYVDDIYLISPNGQIMSREADLIDVWFDSGAMPFAQWHYPFENQEIFKANYPADFISEGVDQTRGWFFTLHAISSMVEDSVAFKNVVSTGLVLDKNGNKMSKRLGNAIDPFETLKKYGADPTRWYMITNAQPWDNLKFDLAGITEVRNKFFGTLTNTYNFFALYANLDGFDPKQLGSLNEANLTELDRWVLSKLMTLIAEVDEAYAQYEPTKAGRAIQDFVCDHLSNWYVRLSRRRFWNPESAANGLSDDKIAAYQTLYTCLEAVAQMMSPIAPFYGEWLYKNLTGKESVHLSDFIQVNKSLQNESLEQSMDLAQRICSLVHSLRKTHKLKVRQPLAQILVPVLNEQTREQIRRVDGLIKTEVNVKEVNYLDDASGVLSKKVKPNFKALGPKFGKDMKQVADLISQMNAETLANLEANSVVTMNGFEIGLAEVEIMTEDMPGYLTASEGGLTIALDNKLTPELVREGMAREFVNRIQNLRKDSGFEVTDKIYITIQEGPLDWKESINEFKSYISQEVQALDIEWKNQLEGATEVNMEDVNLFVQIRK